MTRWTLIPWHLCISGYLTLSPLPLSLMKLIRDHWKMPLYLQLLWMDPLHCGRVSQPKMVLFTLSPMKRVLLKLDSVSFTYLLSYWILALISGGYFFLSHLILISHCYFIIFLPPSKSPGPLQPPHYSSLLLLTTNPLVLPSSGMNLSPVFCSTTTLITIFCNLWIIHPSLCPSHSSTSSFPVSYSFNSPHLPKLIIMPSTLWFSLIL